MTLVLKTKSYNNWEFQDLTSQIGPLYKKKISDSNVKFWVNHWTRSRRAGVKASGTQWVFRAVQGGWPRGSFLYVSSDIKLHRWLSFAPIWSPRYCVKGGRTDKIGTPEFHGAFEKHFFTFFVNNRELWKIHFLTPDD